MMPSLECASRAKRRWCFGSLGRTNSKLKAPSPLRSAGALQKSLRKRRDWSVRLDQVFQSRGRNARLLRPGGIGRDLMAIESDVQTLLRERPGLEVVRVRGGARSS